MPTHEEQLERIWPVALGLALLNEERAEQLVEGALSRKPDLGVVSPARAERLITLESRSLRATPHRPRPHRRPPSLLHAFLERARESHHRRRRPSPNPALHAPAPASTLAQSPSLPPLLEQSVETLRSLPEQTREAWIFVKALKRDVRSASQAMDCSVTALHRLLAQASDAFTHRFNEQAPHAAAAFTAALTQQAPPIPPRFFHAPTHA
ncbi:MAG: hypothetical protein D6824_04230, partial [Planctomycetota bacterium]